jgi:dipicolinate synthase subunit B
MEELLSLGLELQPIMSENVYSTDTRFHLAEEFRLEVEGLAGRRVIHTVAEAEPLGPSAPLEALIIAPCTGNTLAKLAHGITDTAVTMAAKAHLRRDRPLLIALATNDAMSQNLGNIGALLNRKSVYFVPMRQDAPKNKPHSLVADFSRLKLAYEAMMRGEQIRPLFL